MTTALPSCEMTVAARPSWRSASEYEAPSFRTAVAEVSANVTWTLSRRVSVIELDESAVMRPRSHVHDFVDASL